MSRMDMNDAADRLMTGPRPTGTSYPSEIFDPGEPVCVDCCDPTKEAPHTIDDEHYCGECLERAEEQLQELEPPTDEEIAEEREIRRWENDREEGRA